MPVPSKRSALACLTKKRLITLAREHELDTAQAEPKEAFIEALAHSKAASFRKLLEALTLAELRTIGSTHELATSGTKAALVARILAEDAPCPRRPACSTTPRTRSRPCSPGPSRRRSG